MNAPRKLAWHHLKCRIPADWEITAYSIEPRAGRLEFGTRRGFEATVAWEPCRQAPDEKSMMVTFLRKRVPGAPEARALTLDDLRTRHAGRFLVGHARESLPCQAMLHLPGAGKLLTWVFASSSPERIATVYEDVLQSYEPNDGPWRDYAIYGLDFRLPAAFDVEEMVVLPANVMLGFESGERARVTLRRWGLPGMVLGGDPLGEVYARVLRVHGARVLDVSPGRIAGMPGARLSFEQRGQHQMEKFMGRIWRNGRAWVWHDVDERRVYGLETIGPTRATLPDFAEIVPRLGGGDG